METKSQNGLSRTLTMESLLRYRDFLFYTPPWVVDPGDYGITPADLQQLSIRNAILSTLGSVSFPNPDGDDSDVHGPGGPRMRDVLIGLTVAHVAEGLSDRDLGRQLRTSALQGVMRQVEQMQQAVG